MTISARWLIVLGVIAAPLWAANPGEPGTINYVEGDAAIDGSPMDARSVGGSMLNPGQTLETQQGRVEVLLTPGVFLRLGDHSALRMISPGLTDTHVALLRGEAMLEVTELLKENNLRVSVAGAETTIQKTGLYAFDAGNPQVRVYEGKAVVSGSDRQVELGKGRKVVLSGNWKAQKFDRDRHDTLFAWSDVRSEYLAEASVESAQTYMAEPYGWLGGGWYWNPWWSMYSFIPGDGIFYSPFGWGFYAPRYVAFAPRRWYAGGWRTGGRLAARRAVSGRAVSRPVPASGFHSAAAPAAHFGGGFHGR